MVTVSPTRPFSKGIVPQLRLFDPRRHEFPNLPAYLIFDAQYLRKYSFANRPVGAQVPDAVLRAGTLPELAARLGIDGDELEKTVHRFKGFVEAGVDHDFHRGESRWRLCGSDIGEMLERLRSALLSASSYTQRAGPRLAC